MSACCRRSSRSRTTSRPAGRADATSSSSAGSAMPPTSMPSTYFVEEILPRILRAGRPTWSSRSWARIPRIASTDLAGENVRILGYVPGPDPDPAPVLDLGGPAAIRGRGQGEGEPEHGPRRADRHQHGRRRGDAPRPSRDTLIADDPDRFRRGGRSSWSSRASCGNAWRPNGRASVRAHFSIEAVGRQIDDLLALAGLASLNHPPGSIPARGMDRVPDRPGHGPGPCFQPGVADEPDHDLAPLEDFGGAEEALERLAGLTRAAVVPDRQIGSSGASCSTKSPL